MSKVLSLKLRDEIFREAEEIVNEGHRSRNAYFNEAIHFYNKLWKRKLLKQAIAKESALVAQDSMEVLETFEQLEDESLERSLVPVERGWPKGSVSFSDRSA
ncbi:hypothetical protein MYX65_03080 [Acidobacteria bacterium AH-259-L09]|nr:hypothetical protein [Acidobacteria bacterium AH-259-L09]